MKLQVSVVIPAYNSSTYLPVAIESALNQTMPPLEVIVVNDGSTDETPQILQRYKGRIVPITQENRGLSAARNRGIAAARGELIAFLDADDIWLPEKLEKQVACLVEHPQAGLVHTGLLHWNESSGERTPQRSDRRGSCYMKFFSYCGVVVSTVLVPRECLASVGCFDEAICRPTTQDYDLWFRIARHYELAYLEEPLVLYRHHTSNASKQTLAMIEDTLYVVRKALKSDPGLRRALGYLAVNERLFGLLYDIGYHHHDAGRTADARLYFQQALRHRPFNVWVWLLYLANLLPATCVRTLRRMKSSLANLCGCNPVWTRDRRE